MSHYYFFGKDTLNQDRCTKVIGSSPVRNYSSAREILKAVQRLLPSFIIIDYHCHERDTLKLIATLRQQNPAAYVPIVVLIQMPEVESQIQEALYHQKAIILLHPDHIESQFLMQLEMLTEQYFTDRQVGQPHPYAIEILARVWRQSLNGYVELISSSEKVPICNGGVVTINGTPLLSKGIYGMGLGFTETSDRGLGDWLSVGEILWEAACKQAEVGFLRTRLNLSFVPTNQAERALDLPIPDLIVPLLDKGEQHVPFRERLASCKLRHTQVEIAIEALFLLGLYTFKRVPDPPSKENIQSDSVIQTQEKQKLMVVNPLPEISIPPGLTQRLNDEWNNLQVLDEWQIINLKPCLDVSLIQSASAEKCAPYLEWSEFPGDIEIRKLSHKIAQGIEDSGSCAVSIAECYLSFGYSAYPTGGVEILFQEGVKALNQRRYKDAFLCLQDAANLNLDSSRFLCYAGWSAFHFEQYELANEQLEIAVHLDPLHPFILRCFAVLNVQIGQFEVAEKTLKTMLKNNIDTDGAKTLLEELKYQKDQHSIFQTIDFGV